ncbi:hypothetical protein O3P69_012741 [Scylla paramamosain]|uniref:Uncharacterized protein n=1 Tax=Scylla paramamosain TaxID=85552 RepID=A0AAW0SGA1_SCYPA
MAIEHGGGGGGGGKIYGWTTEDLVFLWREGDPVQITQNLHLPRFTLEKFMTEYCNSKTNTGSRRGCGCVVSSVAATRGSVVSVGGGRVQQCCGGDTAGVITAGYSHLGGTGCSTAWVVCGGDGYPWSAVTCLPLRNPSITLHSVLLLVVSILGTLAGRR